MSSGPTGTPKLAVVAPVFNEAASIGATIEEWLAVTSELNAEVVVCDDGSTDGTLGLLRQLERDNPRLRVCSLERNQGPGAALRVAIAATSAEWLCLTDSDGQFNIGDGVEMLKIAEEHQVTMIIGVRAKKDRLLAVLGSRVTGWMANRIYGTRLRDFNCAFKIVRGDWVRNQDLRASRFNYSLDLTSRCLLRGETFLEMPITHLPRVSGTSHARLISSGWQRLLFLMYLYVERVLTRSGALQ